MVNYKRHMMYDEGLNYVGEGHLMLFLNIDFVWSALEFRLGKISAINVYTIDTCIKVGSHIMVEFHFQDFCHGKAEFSKAGGNSVLP
jgi:hypothetical protein